YADIVLNNRTFKYTIIVDVDNCKFENFTFFRVARMSNTPIEFDTGNWWRVIAENNTDTSFVEIPFSIFPNPTTGLINVTYGKNIEYTLIIRDIFGREKSKHLGLINAATISVSDLSVGKYFMILHCGNVRRTAAFIKR